MALHYRHPSLALDMVEPFRHPSGGRLVRKTIEE